MEENMEKIQKRKHKDKNKKQKFRLYTIRSNSKGIRNKIRWKNKN